MAQFNEEETEIKVVATRRSDELFFLFREKPFSFPLSLHSIKPHFGVVDFDHSGNNMSIDGI